MDKLVEYLEVELLKLAKYSKIAWTNLSRRKTRSILNFISISIGIAAVVTMIFVGMGLQTSVEDQFSQIGMDKIYVMPGGGVFGLGGTTLNDNDLKIVKNTAGVKEAGAMTYLLAKVTYKDEMFYLWVAGLDLESMSLVEEAQSIDLVEGRNFKKGDNRKVIVTYLIREGEIFSSEIKPGKTIEIEGIKFEVIGSIDKIGSPDDDSALWILLEDSQNVFNIKDEYNFILVQTLQGQNTSKVAERISENLRKAHGLKEGDEDFAVQTSEELQKSFGQILSILIIVLTGIAAISLFVGGVGTMNVMYTSVLERTKEIGILKAVGAKRFDIMSIFVLESGFLGLVGGVFGIIVGTGLSYIVGYIAEAANFGFLKVTFRIDLALAVLAFSFLIGVVAGYLPAKRAADLKPVDSLRYE
ncbi:MAG TPA: ABC transporter permease [Candidatus Woesearchaeota archaeon]|nr:ABC transporter permease [Candidatus Woesearchaeota archaeon]